MAYYMAILHHFLPRQPEYWKDCCLVMVQLNRSWARQCDWAVALEGCEWCLNYHRLIRVATLSEFPWLQTA
jgi:hypothetical protein